MSAVVQSNSGNTGTGTPASVDVTLGSDTTAGNKVIIVIAGDATVATPSGFTLDHSQVNWLGLYAFSKTAVAETASWTVTPSSSASVSWAVYEISGLTTDAADQTNGQNYTDVEAASTLTTGTTAQDDELCIGVVGLSNTYDSNGALPADLDSWTNSFVQQDWEATTKGAGTVNVGVGVAFYTATAVGTFETTAAWTGVSNGPSALIATYRIASGTVETVVRPIADTAGTGWDTAPTASQSLWSQVDEETASDTDYIYATDPNP